MESGLFPTYWPRDDIAGLFASITTLQLKTTCQGRSASPLVAAG
jgi:hypothetical protein